MDCHLYIFGWYEHKLLWLFHQLIICFFFFMSEGTRMLLKIILIGVCVCNNMFVS